MVPQESYTPTGDPNLLLWFMADSRVTTDMNGVDVLSWGDLSGNGFDAIATATQTPKLYYRPKVGGETVLMLVKAILHL